MPTLRLITNYDFEHGIWSNTCLIKLEMTIPLFEFGCKQNPYDETHITV